MSNRIEIRTPSQVIEASDAIQAANRRRLERRTVEGWTERRAVRLVQNGLQFADSQISRAAANDPWNGAVPEYDPVPTARGHLFGKQFKTAAAWWRWDEVGKKIIVKTGNKQVKAEILLPDLRFVSYYPLFPGTGPVWTLALPAGGDRMMLVFYYQGVDWIQAGAGTHAPFPDPPLYEGQQFSTFDARYTVFSDIRQYVIIKTVLVSESAIKIGDCPPNLDALLRQRLTYLTSVEIEQYLEYIPVLDWIIFRVDENSLGASYTPGAGFTQLQPKIEYTYANSNHYERDLYAWLYLLRSYGYGHLVNTTPQDPAWGWTPAVFSFLKNYNGEFHVSKDDQGYYNAKQNATDYDYIASKYFPDDAPPIFLTSGYQNQDALNLGIDTTSQYYYFSAPTANLSVMKPTAFVDTALRLRVNNGADKKEPVQSDENQDYEVDQQIQSSPEGDKGVIEARMLQYPWRQGQEVPVITWDWGRPLACWIQLLRLGFDATDLMLTDDERNALMAADWSTAGFKF